MNTRKRSFALIACLFTIAGCARNMMSGSADTNEEAQPIMVTQSGLIASCGVVKDCAPYAACIGDGAGTMQCINHQCSSIGNTPVECTIRVFAEQCLAQGRTYEACLNEVLYGSGDAPVSTTPTATPSTSATASTTTAPASTPTTSPATSTWVPTCGEVTPPKEATDQAYSRAFCSRAAGPGSIPSTGRIKVWVNVAADTAGSTIRVDALSLYGVLPNRTSVPIGGSAVNGSAITWAGLFSRNPWFPEGQGKLGDVALTPNNVYDVSTNPYVLHFGNEGALAGPYIDYFAVALVQTTGDATFDIGIDGYLPGSTSVNAELGTSSWHACSTGGSIMVASYNSALANPCSNQIGTIGVAPTATVATATVPTSTVPTATTTVASCPASGVEITAGPSLLSTCSSGLQIVTWGGNSQLIASPPGKPLSTSFASGFAFMTTMCSGSYQSNAWAIGSSAQSAGFVRVCSGGKDITAQSVICNSNGPKLSVAVNPSEAGRCQ